MPTVPANGVVAGNPTADHTATRALALFNTGETYKYSNVDEVRLTLGATPSTAICHIPIASGGDETAPTIAGITGGPLDDIKVGTPVKVLGSYGSGSATVGCVLLCGRVTQVSGEFGELTDDAVIEVADDRWLLRSLPVIGAWTAGYQADYTVSFREWRATVNPGGAPNCIWRTLGGRLRPVFCESYYGMVVDGTPANPGERSQDRACFWTPVTLIEYLMWTVSEAAKDVSGLTGYPWNSWGIIMDGSLSSALEAEPNNNYKHAKERTLESSNFLDLLDDVARECGDFTIMLGPQVNESEAGSEDWVNKLFVVRDGYNGGGVTLNAPASGNAGEALATPKIVTEGGISESGHNYYTDFSIAGRLVLIERRVDTTLVDGITGLIPAWSTAEQDGWLDMVQSGATQEEGVRNANRKYPAVFLAYRLDPLFDYQADTTESAKPRARVARPVLPHLLTSYIEGGTNTRNSDRLRFRRPVLLEYANENLDEWLPADYSDGFSMDSTGALYFPGLRELGRTFALSGSHGSQTVAPWHLRMTLAIPCDHRSRVTKSVPKDDAGQDRVDPELVRYFNGDARESYGTEIRKGGADADTSGASYPQPASAGGTPSAADTVLRTDENELSAAVGMKMKELGRLTRGGTLIMPRTCFAMQPGLAVKQLSRGTDSVYPIRSIVTRVIHHMGEPVNRTVLELGER